MAETLLHCSGTGSQPVRIVTNSLISRSGQCRHCDRIVALDGYGLIGWHVDYRGWAP